MDTRYPNEVRCFRRILFVSRGIELLVQNLTTTVQVDGYMRSTLGTQQYGRPRVKDGARQLSSLICQWV